MNRRSRLAVIVPALALVISLALTGCGKLDARPGTGSIGSTGFVGTQGASSPTTTAPADDSAAIDGIAQDLDSAGAANTEAGSNSAAGDQAGAAGDEP
ncbi:MAG: hypothetical protein ABIO06_11745 [Pseudolysinimonas sp.]